MIEKIKNLEISEKEKTELKWWLDNGLQEIYEYLENWKFETDISEKFNEKRAWKSLFVFVEARKR